MLPRQLIEQLEAFDSAKDRVLSTFSTSHPIGAPAIPYRVALEEAVRGRLQTEEPRGQGLALFFCAARGLWHAAWKRAGDDSSQGREFLPQQTP